ncbi:heat-inducible transcription repressor HrcA [bacterium]|nr:heat-inducible transcription repressor HrcA [bacterium]
MVALDDRKSAVLAGLVEEYIRSGEPVSSRAVLDRAGLTCSSATIRNEFALLERDGYILKPHTSAGRIPTDSGYRYYLDHLSPGSLRHSTRTKIDTFFSSMHAELNRLLKETSGLLSEITHYPAVVLGPGLGGHTVRDAHLIPIEPGVVLFVLVTDHGRVSQSVLHLDSPVTPDEVLDAQEALESIVSGVEIEASGPAGSLEPPPGLAPHTLAVVDRALGAVTEVARGHREVHLGGTSHMASLWEDFSKLARILSLLDREAAVLQLLDPTAHGTSVRIGSELSADEDDLAVVSTTYDASGDAGRVGVFGPLRMDYRRTIKVVEEVSDALGDTLGG